KRTSWRVVSGVERENVRVAAHRKGSILLAQRLTQWIEKELTELCDNYLTVIDSLARFAMSPKSSGLIESKVFYNKLKGDINRYLAEFSVDPKRQLSANKSHEPYQFASLMSLELSPATTLRLSLAMNFSIFLYEILNLPDEAYRLAEKAIRDAIEDMDMLSEVNYTRVEESRKVLHRNLTLGGGGERGARCDSLS
ncbi:14-3-3 domain-containing protein, partial [Favolaschia claudopus]